MMVRAPHAVDLVGKRSSTPGWHDRLLCAHPGRSADFCHCSEAEIRREVMNGEVWWEAAWLLFAKKAKKQTLLGQPVWRNAE